MLNFMDNFLLKFSKEKCFLYAVLRQLLILKRQTCIPISVLEIHESINKPYFPISIEKVEEILEEFYNHSLLVKREFEGEEIKYYLDV